MISDLKILRGCEELELLTDIRDFTTLFFMILRRESSEWFKSSIESLLGMLFAVWNLDLVFAILLSSNTLSSVRRGY